MSCKKLVKLPSAKENRQSILKRALEYMTGFLCEGKSQEEILHRIAEFLTKSYKKESTVLYGGNITISNYNAYLSQNNINGVLIGKESLNKENLKNLLNIK